MDNTITLGDYTEYKAKSTSIFIEWIRGIKVLIQPTEVDNLSFMESFDAPPLSEVRTSLTSSGNYTQEQVEEIVAGLSTLPEYN